MTVRDLLGEGPEVEVSYLANDHRQVSPGTLFFCVPGFTRDGHDFAAEAVARGAVALVVERRVGAGVPEVRVPDVRAAMARAAARFHGDPSAALKVIGITGTNGKTTTAFLTRELLEAAGVPCGLLGTVKAVIGGVEEPVVRTTPESIDLQATLAAMVATGDSACAMEVSSHALELHRVDGVHFACALFTNLTQDHLDFHPSMEDYFQAKRRLFVAASGAARVVNADDPYGRRLASEFPGTTTFSLERPADYRASDIEISLTGSRFTLRHGGTAIPVACRLPGAFNVANILGAVAACASLGLPLEDLVPAVEELPGVPGRFEPVDDGQDFAVLVDYAHTPDSLANVLHAARALSRRRLITVFGCGGDRDRGKRPLMGAIAARESDLAIVTSDNPRSEDPRAIVADVLSGAPDGGLEMVLDRRAAIARAIAAADGGDVVLIAGKGHERGQEFAGGRREPFDDVAVAHEALRARAASGHRPGAVRPA
jgi:UDP-N-acetylmuramoyl-L-alanyl-D-glutamate--2,6-diaminopimelate ligase